QQPVEPQTAEALVALSLHAFELARKAAARAGDAVASGKPELFQEIERLEQELDSVDREVDEGMAQAVTQLSVEQARELLACLKFTIDLERIGDLIAGFGARGRALGPRLEAEDMRHLVEMAAVLERMLVEAYRAFTTRDLNRAFWVLKADAEIDRLRNLVFFRHLNPAEGTARSEGVHVVFMAQALERAGDHATNLAEEIIHFASGRSVRHMLQTRDRGSQEQMFLEWLRNQQPQPRAGGSEPGSA
ncbi:MAG: phosphate signaling complex PhoU family protein, partial [Terriglobales bacterium]